MRTFIAIELPPDIKNILSRIQDELKQSRADVKWVNPQNIHLTLRFLGEIQQDLVDKLRAVLEQIAQKNSPFSVRLSNLGAFPKLQYPRVVWFGINNDQPVLDIARNLENEIVKIGLSAEDRPFSSHITLGRVRSGLNRKALVEKIESLNKNFSSSSPEFKVLSITLFKSTLTPQGPIYESVLNCPLSSKIPD